MFSFRVKLSKSIIRLSLETAMDCGTAVAENPHSAPNPAHIHVLKFPIYSDASAGSRLGSANRSQANFADCPTSPSLIIL